MRGKAGKSLVASGYQLWQELTLAYLVETTKYDKEILFAYL